MFHKQLISFFMVFACVGFTVAPISAAQTPTEQTQAEKEAAALKAREAAEARIDADMVQMSDVVEALSKNLGQLHFLRRLCFGEKDQYWRDFAAKMLKIEASNDPGRQEYLTRAFNAGYTQEQERFKSCTPNVSVDAAALAENGRHLASMLGDPNRDF